MSYTVTVEKKLEDVAKLGLFSTDLKIGKNKANELEKQGCTILDSKEFNYFPRLHHVSWKNAMVECRDVKLLDERSDNFTLAEKLWIISTKNQPKAPWLF